MSFKRFEEYHPHRFMEFDEARIYIEDMLKDPQMTQEAVDYMVHHRQYHFLLKNLISQFYQGGGNRQLFDYIFSKLSECPRRNEDLQLYIQILDAPNNLLRDSFLGYLRSCADKLYPFILDMLKSSEAEKRRIAVCILRYLPKEEVEEVILEHARGEEDTRVIEEVLKYLEIYISEGNVDCLHFLKDKFPEFEERISRIIQNL
ncbi:hypothetical protein [Persephonella sp.]